MFTGLIKGMGTIIACEPRAHSRDITIQTDLDLSNEVEGASIACSGVCLTALNITQHTFMVQAGQETLTLTTAANWGVGTKLNLEPSLRVGEPLGGHMVTGHVDGKASITAIKQFDDCYECYFKPDPSLLKFIAKKGSVAIDGVSLTVNDCDRTELKVMIIPHTWAVTTIGHLQKDDTVNLEVDILARYIARMQDFT